MKDLINGKIKFIVSDGQDIAKIDKVGKYSELLSEH